ncbi:hypothetical protein BaOVIS_028750 [Babesia ovis]|uniref:Uncharacterized protein n=1 Tax=Babesia ovis TaxID=5869 RepID=A0A9W5TD17_BABOV|nr:hypothetical protein BaOVIS_028750 [Babesia ovis]
MSDVIDSNSSLATMSRDMQAGGTTYRRIEDELQGLNSLTKPKTVIRVSDSVQRCGTTASDSSSICESTDVYTSNDASPAESDKDIASNTEDSLVSSVHPSSSDLVIFDYDDTILPTYSLACSQRSSVGHLLDPATIAEELERLTESVLANLTRVLRVSRLVVVTNASYEWLMQSCERYLPRVSAFFAENNIRIISARDRLENSLLSQRHWKYFIFIDLIEEYFMDQLKNGAPFTVTSIGDGAEEREACVKLAAIFKNQCWVFKNLKFLTQPTLGCLIQQHVLLGKSFDNFFAMKTSADLCILFDKNKSQNGQSP